MKLLRAMVIFTATFAVLATAFYFVWKSQLGAITAASTVHPQPLPAPAKPIASASEISHGGVGAGDAAWFDSYENGVLVSQFRGTQYTPQKDGSFHVDQPVSIHYMDNGQYAVITGDNGMVFTDTAAPSASNSGLPMPEAPRSGWLHHVHVAIFPNHNAMSPTLTMDTDNIHFDNETLRMYTESYVNDQGESVKADMVPVKLRGDAYEFDGKGLTIRWNGRDKRLQRLEVSHGDRLEIKNASKMSMPGSAANPPAQSLEQPSAVAEVAPPARGRLSAVHHQQTARPRLIANTTITPAVKPAPPYQAVFSDNVRIFQGDLKVAVADVMTIDFFMQGEGDSSNAAPAKGKPRVANTPVMVPPAADESDQPPPAVQQMVQQSAAPATPAAPSTILPTSAPATTQASAEPITIRWTGSLLVTPLETEPMMPLLPRQSVVRLVGSPAILTPAGAVAQTASVTYRSPDEAVKFESSPAAPVITMQQINKDKTPGLFLTNKNSVVYDPQTSLTTLYGPSTLTVPMQHQDPMTVTWDKFGVLHTVKLDPSKQISGVDQVDLIGMVVVTHPQLALNSDELKIGLDVIPVPNSKSGQAKEQPRLMTATGSVICRIKSPGKPDQGLTGDTLAIAIEQSWDDKPYPRKINADGNVVTSDPDQRMTADHLEVYMVPKLADQNTSPTTQSTDAAVAVELESLHATSRVHVLTKDKSTADCDDLRVTAMGTQHLVELSGDNGATLTDVKGSRLIGSVVHISPERDVITVDGAGTLHTVQSSASTQPTTKPASPRPIDISWTDSMAVDGPKNIADVVGHVIVKSTTDSTGEVSTITGDKAHLDFVDPQKSATRRATTAPVDPMAGAVGSKQLKVMTLAGNVHGESALKDMHELVVRQEILDSHKLVYTATDGRVTIPGAGKMFMENHRANDQATSGNSNGGGDRGAMAVQWRKQLIYDPNALKIFIDGDTRVGFEKQAQKNAPVEAPMQLDAQHLIITLQKVPNAKADPPSPDGGKTKLQHLQANGLAHFSAKAIDLDCDTIDYDPDSQTLTARGYPGSTTNATGTAIGTFDILVYDVAKQMVVSTKNMHGAMRP